MRQQRPHHMSELSSESGGRLTSLNPPGVIFEMAEGKAVELEDPSDTATWARNQRRLAEQHRFELQGDIPLGTEHSTSVTPAPERQARGGGGGLVSEATGSQLEVSPGDEIPSPQLATPERDEERTLE
jgi:hypothetical protein